MDSLTCHKKSGFASVGLSLCFGVVMESRDGVMGEMGKVWHHE